MPISSFLLCLDAYGIVEIKTGKRTKNPQQTTKEHAPKASLENSGPLAALQQTDLKLCIW